MPLNWKISEQTIIQPDLLIICNTKPKGLYFQGIPELVVEISSKSTLLKDRNTKFGLYESQKVRYYVLILRNSKHVIVYEMKDNQYREVFNSPDKTFQFSLGQCMADIDFAAIW